MARKKDKVECAHDAMVPIGELIPNPKNPNLHSGEQISLLAKIIKAQGWRAPITVSNRSGFIVRGHGRLMAAHEAGIAECPVDYQDYKTEAEEWADLIADNRLSALSDFAPDVLKDVLQELDTGAFDMDLTGFDEKAIEALMTATGIPGDNKDIDEAAMKDTKNECPRCGFTW